LVGELLGVSDVMEEVFRDLIIKFKACGGEAIVFEFTIACVEALDEIF
jgi:hypothetical protein